jgi:KUP system potassium uptake protein
MVLCVAVTVAFRDTTLIGNAYGELFVDLQASRSFLSVVFLIKKHFPNILMHWESKRCNFLCFQVLHA